MGRSSDCRKSGIAALKAEVHLFEGGDFLLEEHAEAVATLIRKFLGRHRTLSAADGQSGASSD